MEEVLRQATMINNGTPVEKMTASWSVGLEDEERIAFASRWVNKCLPARGLCNQTQAWSLRCLYDDAK
jgi:hypothetical protein